LTIYRSNRLETLAERLSAQLGPEVDGDPMTPIEVLVGSRGMERWLRQEIGARLGVCCNVAFRFLAPMLSRLEAVFGVAPAAGTPLDSDPWQPDTLCWRVLRILEARRGEEGWREVDRALSPNGQPPGGSVDRLRYAFARRVADLLDRYLHDRPDWFTEAGGSAWPSDAGWQRALFEALERDLGRTHFPARILALRDAIRSERPMETCGALHVFGLSSLPPAVLDLLRDLSTREPVHLYLLAATQDYLGDLAKGDAASPHDPLLGSLGRLSRAMQALCLERLPDALEDDAFVHVDAPQRDTVLGRLQGDLCTNATAQATPRAPLRAEDTSLRVHDCYGPARQVEVLREDLLHLFAGDASLQPRDVVVMTPDIETYAPLVQAIFAQGREHRLKDRETGAPLTGREAWGPSGAPRIPVEIADLGLRQTNALADVLMRVLELATGRLTASAFDGLLGLSVVQRRFGMDEEQVARVRDWLGSTGIRWALDGHDRDVAMGEQGASDDPQNTFAFGLARLALGVTMANEGQAPWQPLGGTDAGPPDPEAYTPQLGVLPIDDMEGEAVSAFGAFAELVRTIARWRDVFRAPMPLGGWCGALRGALDDLTETSDKASWLRGQVEDLLDGVEKGAATLYDGPVGADALAALLEGKLDNPRRGDRVVTGAVTVCALQPMRSVPFRVICLLGLEEDVFPRRTQRPGFDLAARAPRLGDRDPRDEDRHLLLEALLSARSHLHVFYTGRDVRTKQERPLAVPISELLDAVDARFDALPSSGTPRKASEDLRVEHALQPFGLRNFATGARAIDPHVPGAWSFDLGLRAAAEGLRLDTRRPAQTLFDWRNPADVLDPPAPPNADAPFEIHLDNLSMFLVDPAAHLLRRRLSVYLGERDGTLDDREPIDLDALEKWSLGDQVLRACVEAERDGANTTEAAAQARARMRAEGVLPLGAAGELLLDASWGTVEAILGATAETRGGARRSVPVSVDLPKTELRPALRLVGSVDDVFASDTSGADLVLLGMTVSDVSKNPKHRLRTWVSLLAAQASCPDERLRAALYGKDPTKPLQMSVACDKGTPPQQVARALLERLVERCFESLSRPVPLYLQSSCAFATAKVPDAALDAALEAWHGKEEDDAFGTVGDSADPYIRAVWGPDPPFLDAEGRADAAFASLAYEVWTPVLAAISAGGAR